MILRGKPIALVVEALSSSDPMAEEQRPLPSQALVADLASPILAYRAWRLDGGGLVSVTARAAWSDRTLVASCSRQREAGGSHTVPGALCRCGIYALHEPPSSVFDRLVWGAVALDGRVLLYQNGLRAERATILVLAHAGSAPPSELVRAARELDVGLVPSVELMVAAGSHGAEPPPSLRDAVALGIGRGPDDADGAWDALSPTGWPPPAPLAAAAALPDERLATAGHADGRSGLAPTA
jgi:hypothetical protein